MSKSVEIILSHTMFFEQFVFNFYMAKCEQNDLMYFLI